jgi:hypothetical protein
MASDGTPAAFYDELASRDSARYVVQRSRTVQSRAPPSKMKWRTV